MLNSNNMEIATQIKEKYTIVFIDGRLDTTNYQDLEKELQLLVGENINNLIINCEKLNYVSSSGLRVFLMFLKKIKAMNGKFLICNMQDSIKEIFQISGFTSIFDIYESLDKAEQAI